MERTADALLAVVVEEDMPLDKVNERTERRAGGLSLPAFLLHVL